MLLDAFFNIEFLTRAIVFLIDAIGFWLIYIVYSSSIKKSLSSSFVLMTFFMLIWVDFAYIARLPSQVDLALLWIKISWAVTIPLFASLYFFVVYFLKIENRYKVLNLFVFFLGAGSFFLTLFTDLIIEDIKSQQVWTKLIYGDYVILFYAQVLFLSFVSLYFLLKKFFHSNRADKLRIQYFLMGIAFFLFMNVVFNIVFPAIFKLTNYYQLGDYSTVISMSFIAYAITRKNLMGIRTMLTQSFIVLISAILLFDIFFLSVNLLNQFLKSTVLIIFLYLSRELIISVKREKSARKKLEKVNSSLEEKNRYLKILLDVSDKIGSELDSKKISNDIVDSIPESLEYLGYKVGIIVLCSSKGDCVYVRAVTNSPLTKKIEKEMDINIEDLHQDTSNSENLVIKTIRNKKIYIGSKADNFFSGFLKKEESLRIQKIVDAKSFVSLPLFSGGRVIGGIVFMGNKRIDTVNAKNKGILKAFSSHIGTAIENAKLYEKTNTQMKEVRKLNVSLKGANKRLKELLEIKNEFLHITSHQLRTPLTAIRGMISMWIEGDFDALSPERKKEMLQRIYNSTERLNNITNDMMDALELEGGAFKLEFKKVSIVDMLNDTVTTLEPEYKEKGLYLKFVDPKEKIPEVEAESNYLGQIFMNLIDNACKYTRQGGTVVEVSRDKKYVNVTIKDTGMGIGEKDLVKVFDKFTRGENAVIENASGSGLGLFIVKKMVDEHKGKIKLESKEGKGTTFYVSIPIKQE